MSKIIDGKKISEEIQGDIRKEILDKKLNPSLAVLLIGNNPASELYVNLKKKACHKVGIEFHEYLIDEETNTEHVLEVIDFLNKDEHTDAILIQLPLPKHLNTDKIIKALDPKKDVDGFHPQNIENLLKGKSNFTPGLALGISKLIESTKEKLKNKKAIIIAKNDILYKPLAKLLQDKGIEVEIVKPKDKKIKEKSSLADILIVAYGKPFFITADMVKKDSIIIDIGTNKIDNRYVVGDVDYSAVFSKVGHITPVPGGVGPMTVAMLLYNTLELSKL